MKPPVSKMKPQWVPTELTEEKPRNEYYETWTQAGVQKFMAPAASANPYGIIIAARHDAHELVRRLFLVLNRSTSDEMQNQVRCI